MITLLRLRRLEAALRRRGYGPTIAWSESIAPPANAEAFATEAIYVVINAGLRVIVAEPIFRRCMAALKAAESAFSVFGHPGKAKAIDALWEARGRLYDEFRAAHDPLAYLEILPWIGKVTRHHLLKNLGEGDQAKPDVHLTRLANRDRTTTAKLCAKLAHLSGYRIATIDTILWRACADGLLDSRRYECEGWTKATNSEVTSEAWSPGAAS